MSPDAPDVDIKVVDETLPTPGSPAPESTAAVADDEKPRAETPPPEVNLDALIAELRASLASSQTLLSTQATRLSSLTDLETEHAQLKDQYAFLAAAKEAVEKQLQEETKRREMAEENVELLRGQVEQARRGVGILQKQEQDRKRLSHIPSGAGGLGLSTEAEEVLAPVEAATSKASKRSSVMLGRGHRRTSSQSEPGNTLHVVSRDEGFTSPNLNAPRAGGLRELRLGSGGPVTSTAGPGSSPVTQTSFFDDSTPLPVPPPMNKRQSSNSIPASNPLIESPSRSEEAALRAELAAVRTKLATAEEAREASEACLKALREFMAGGGPEGGAAEDDLLKNIRLPPLPTDRDPDELAPPHGSPEKKQLGWGGFKLWKHAPVSPALSTSVEPPATPGDGISPPASVRGSITPAMSPVPAPGELPTENTVGAVPASSTPLANFVTGWTKAVHPGTPGTEGKPIPARSLSSFFSRKKGDQAERDKDLPPAPVQEEVIDLTDDAPGAAPAQAEREHASQEGGAPATQETQTEKADGDKLEPSPVIKDREIEDPREADTSPTQSVKSLKDVPLEGEGEADVKADVGQDAKEDPK